MIIVEGMDGTGKSSLIARLCDDLNLPRHARASDSTKGPVGKLWEWAFNDVMSWATQPNSIYDRHPLISEYIYGPITRKMIDRRFFGPEAQLVSRILRENATVVFCDPGHLVTSRNITAQPQMSGVISFHSQLYWAYLAFFHNFNGTIIPWDYTRDSYEATLDRIRATEAMK